MANLAQITESAKVAVREGGVTVHENLCINCILQQRAKSTSKQLGGDAYHPKEMARKTAIRATSFLCLVGIGLGLGSLLLYRLCTRVFSNAIPEEKKKRPSSSSAAEFPENGAKTDKLSPETPDSGIADDMETQCDHSVPVTPQSPEDAAGPEGGTPGGIRFRGHTDFQERDGFVFVNRVSSPPSSMASLPLTNTFSKGLGRQAHLGEPHSSSDLDVSGHAAGHRMARYRNVSERACDLGDVPTSFMSTCSDIGFYSGHFSEQREKNMRGGGESGSSAGSEFSTPASYSSESLARRNKNCMHDTSFSRDLLSNSANNSALGHPGPMEISAQAVWNHSTPASQGAPVKFTCMSSGLNQDGNRLNNNGQDSLSPLTADALDNSAHTNYASFHMAPYFQSTPDDAHNNNNRGGLTSGRSTHRNRRPSSANNTCWPPQRAEGCGLRRQHSYGSDISGLSDFSVRDGLRDKGHSVDLGENLSGLDTPDSDMFEAQDVGGSTVTHIELIQNQLQSIRQDIEEMNTKVVGLNSLEDIPRECYSLGCGVYDDRLRVTRRHRRHRSGSCRSRSSSMDRLSEENNAESRRSYHYQGEFMWDYQSDLANEDTKFVARRPFVGDSVFSSDVDSEHSLTQSPKMDHIKKYLEDSARSPINMSGMDRSQTINSIADLYIDDDYSGLAAADSNANLEEEDTRRHMPHDPHGQSRLLRPSPPGRSVSPVPAPRKGALGYNDLNSPGNLADFKGYHSPKLKVHHIICPSCNCSNVSCDASTSTSPLHAPVPEHSAANNNITASPLSCHNCHTPPRQSAPHPGSRASPPGSLGKSGKSWTVTNVGEKCNLYEYAATEWKGDTPKASNIRKGYHQIPGLLNLTHIRQVRGDNYCALRATIYQAFVNNHPVLQMLGSLEHAQQELSIFNDYKHYYLKSWSFANRLPYSKDNLLVTLSDCLHCFYQKAKLVSNIKDYSGREEFMLNMLNQNPDVDIKLLEAIKVLMMLKAIRLYDDYTAGRNTPVFAWLLFARDTSESPEGLFRNHINVLGDSAGLEQESSVSCNDLEIEMFLLGHTLGVKIEVVRPSHVGQDDFISHYPDEGADGFPKVYLIAEDDRHYNVIA